MEKGSSRRGSDQPPAPPPPPKRLATGVFKLSAAAAESSSSPPHPLGRTASGAAAPSPGTISEVGPLSRLRGAGLCDLPASVSALVGKEDPRRSNLRRPPTSHDAESSTSGLSEPGPRRAASYPPPPLPLFMPPPVPKLLAAAQAPAIHQQEPQPENPLFLLATSRVAKFSLGCPLLDRLLSGGLPSASVTEIAGESASGKTQLCLQLALLAPLRESSSSLFLCSDIPFPLRRLRLLVPRSHPDILDHVLVATVDSPSHLLSLLSIAQHQLSHPGRFPHRLPIRLIIIDSIASLFRADFGASPADLKRRSGLFFKISAKLKEMAYKHQCVVVVTNQVVDFFSENIVTNTIAWSSGRQVSPVLGLAWANCVNTRLFLTKEVGTDGGSTRRHMTVAFAPHLPEQSCEFVIRKDGVFGVEPERRFLSTANVAEQTRLHSHQPISSHRLNSDYIQPEDEDLYIEPEDLYIEPEDDYFSDEDE